MHNTTNTTKHAPIAAPEGLYHYERTNTTTEINGAETRILSVWNMCYTYALRTCQIHIQYMSPRFVAQAVMVLKEIIGSGGSLGRFFCYLNVPNHHIRTAKNNLTFIFGHLYAL